MSGFSAGASIGAISGFAGGFVGAAGNAWVNGASFGDGLVSGFKGGASGAFAGGVLGGITGGVKATKDGRYFWSGKHKPIKSVNFLKSNGMVAINNNVTLESSNINEIKLSSFTPESTLHNPTGLPMRGTDSQGSGYFGASRGSRIHTGIDILSEPNQNLVAPISGKAQNFYGASTKYGMISIKPDDLSNGISKIEILYANPKSGVQLYQQYQVIKGKSIIGKAVDLMSKGYYPNAIGMKNHIHVYVYDLQNNRINPTPFFNF